MAYTNKHTIKHKRSMIDLRELERETLENLKQQMALDLADIENQIAWAKSNLETRGVAYNYDWMEKAITASQIKQHDISKIDVYLDVTEVSMTQEETDLRELLTTVKEYMDGRLAPVVLDELLERLNRRYKQ